MSLNDTDTFLILKPKSEWRMDSKEQLIEEIRKIMDHTPVSPSVLPSLSKCGFRKC